MDLFTCSACGGKLVRDTKLGMGVCQNCGKVNKYVFISYSTKNQKIADSVLHIFTEQGVPVWMAPNDIPVGEVYASIISRALNNCACLVLLLSKESQESVWVTKEVEMALSANKPILPMQIDDLVLNETFCFLIHANQIKALPKLDIQDFEFQKLLTVVKKYVGIDSPLPPPPPKDGLIEKLKRWLKNIFQKRKNMVIVGLLTAALILAAIALLPKKQEEKADRRDSVSMLETTETPESIAPSNEWKANVLASDADGMDSIDNEIYNLGISRGQIVSVTFYETVEAAPQDAQDVSEVKNGSVLAWAMPNGGVNDYNEETYDLFFAADGGINVAKATSEMFKYYYALEVINFGDAFHTDMTVDMHDMFAYCRNLKALDLSGFHTANVTDMSNMFCGCESITVLDMSNFDTSQVRNMSGMFRECKALMELDLVDMDTANVTNMGAMFLMCENLLQIDISSFHTENVQDMSYMFNQCEMLKELNVSNFDTSNVSNMYAMFNECRRLQKLDVSNFNTSKVKDMSAMFQRCERLTELNVSNFETAMVSNMSGMFNGCINLIELDLSVFNTSNVVDMRSMFCNCNSLSQINIPSFDTGNVTNMTRMFAACESLTKLDVSSFDTSNVKLMGHMFYGCVNLSKLDLSGFDSSNVKSMSYMFRNCTNLAELNLGTWDTSNVIAYLGFMNEGEKYNGLPWENLFIHSGS